MEFIQPLFDIMKCIWKPIGRRVDYAKNLSKNFTELNKRTKDLCHKRDDILDKIDSVKLQKAPTRECKDWLAHVNEIEKEVTMIENDHLVDKRCFKGWFPDFFAHVKLGERVVEMIASVKELQEKSFEGGFVTDLPPKKVEIVPVPTMIAANRTLQKIVSCIKDKEKQKIGIWGMGGVGKTTLLKHLNNMLEIENMFDIVTWITVSRSSNISKIQDEIANRLSLDIKSKSTDTRKSDDEVSRMLFSELKGKKYLLLLDDVWESVDLLSKVGIPSTNEDNGSKVVLTTRELRICRDMETDADIKVETLSEGEAWQMFESKVGDTTSFPAIKPIAQEIVKQCGGLPLALNVVGGALRKVEDVDVWKNLLKKLKAPDMANVNYTSEPVFDSLKVSYDQLKDINIKNCFLYCGLYPEDHKISKSQLINYWRAEELISRKATLAEALVEGRALLHDLTDASLLEKCEDDKHVKMHDMLRDLILKMSSSGGGKESRQVVRAGVSREHKILDDEDWDDATRISFMFNELYVLPEMPNCPKLLTLLLQSRNYKSMEAIPEYFFNHMPSLRVLDLSYTSIISLPSSVSNLVNLRTLLLNHCSIEALPGEVSALKRLEMLCLARNSMTYIPNVVWELTSLRCLKFSCWSIGVVSNDGMNPNGMLSKLCLLEELIIVGDHIKRESAKRSWQCLQNEAACLTQLSSLGFRFGRAGDLKQFVLNSKPWRDGSITKFRLFVGEIPYSWRGEYKPYKTFLFCGDDSGGGGSSSSFISALLTDVLKFSEGIALEYQELPRKLSDFGVENMHDLKYCRLYKCGALENIVDKDGIRVGAFSNLECLILENLTNLQSICERSHMQLRISSSRSFISLRRLEISYCYELRTLFTRETIPINLELLKIVDCSKFEEMMISADDINEGSSKTEYVTLPKLKRLELKGLRAFVGFSKGNFSLCCPELQEVYFLFCKQLRKLPFGGDGVPRLRKIHASQLWWEELEWEDDAVKSRFSPFFSPVESISKTGPPMCRSGSHVWIR